MLSSLEESTPGISAWTQILFFLRTRPRCGSGDPEQHRDLDYDGRIHRICDLADDAYARVNAIFAAHPDQLRKGPHDAMDARRFPRNVLLLHGGAARCTRAPHPFVPVATVTGAMVFALVYVGWLIYFINHISRSISVNHIVDRIARETEQVIEELMPYPRGPFSLPDREGPRQNGSLLNRRSGYIRYVNINRLVALSQAYRICVHLERRVGQFVPAGVALMRVSKAERVPADRALHLVAAFDIGPAHPAAGCRVRYHPDR